MRRSIQNVLALFVVIVSIFTFINMVSVDRAEAVTCPEGMTCTLLSPVSCPVGYTCVRKSQPSVCPLGYNCEPVAKTNQCYRFETNLSVGSTGADVVALQTLLIAKGFDIPDISSTEGTKGYFGSGTKTAVMRYQTSIGVPATGFVGPLTRKALNGLCNSLERVTVSNTSAVLGSPINQANVVIAFPVTLNFTINNNGEVSIYLSSKASEILNPSGFNEPPIVSYSGVLASSPTTLSGDSEKIFVIPSGTSRTFKVNGVMKNNGGKAGLKTLKVGNILYRLSADSEKVEVIKDGLENLEVSAFFGDDSIHQPSIRVLSPTGGIYKIGDSMQILWNTTNIPPNQDMDISLMLDAVGVGKPIASVKNIGSYTWKVTDIKAFYDNESSRMIYPNGNYKIDVVCAGDNDVCDSMTSNFGESATFAIATSAAPTQTPSYTPVPSTNATLSASLLPTNIDKAGQWSVFAPGNGAGGVGGTTDSADWNWSMDLNLMAEKKISSVTVRQTNGEYWSTDNRTYFPLVIIDSTGRQLNSQYSNDFGSFRSGQYKWTLYGQKNTSAWVGGHVTVVFSDGTKITENITTGSSRPSITVLSPNGGETYAPDQKFTVGFMGSTGRTYINLVDSNGAGYDLISFNNYHYNNIKDPYYPVTGGGLYDSAATLFLPKDWVASHGTQYKIELCSVNGCDRSDNYFTITSNSPTPSPTPVPRNPSLNVTSPKSGEVWSIGDKKTITWSYVDWNLGVFGNKYVDLYLVPTDGRSPIKLATNFNAPDGSVPVTIYERTSDGRPAWLPGRYKIRVVCNTNNVAPFNSCVNETVGYITIISTTPSPTPTQSPTSMIDQDSLNASIWNAVRDYFNSQP